LAARRRRLHRPARRGDRHRFVGDPVDPADRRAGRAPRRVPAHAQLFDSRAQRRARGRARARGEIRLLRVPAAQCRTAVRRQLPAESGARLAGRRRRARARLRGALADRRARLHHRVRRPLDRPPGEPDRGGVRAREDPRDRERSGDCGEALAQAGDRLQAAVRRHGLLRGVQPARTYRSSTCPRRRSRRSRRAASASRVPCTRSTRSYSRPASTR